MPLRVPNDAKTARISYLTLIRAVSTLLDRRINNEGGLKDKAKAAMIAKDVRFAESDLCVAELRPGSGKGAIAASTLYELVNRGKITHEQALSCFTVSTEAAKKILGENVVDALRSTVQNPAPSLVIEWREGVQFDPDNVATELAGLLARAIPVKAA